MTYEVLDPSEFISGGMFREDDFLKRTSSYDWSRFANKMALVRGCSTIVPPWIFMHVMGKLQPYAKSIRYGNEHDNVVVWRKEREGEPSPSE